MARAQPVAVQAPDLGNPDDYRVPDLGYHRSLPHGAFAPTAAVVVEILSPDDETFEKFDFYAAHGVDEILVADLRKPEMRCWHRATQNCVERAHSSVLDVSRRVLGDAIEWPS